MRRVTGFLILTGVSTLAACASQVPATSPGGGAGKSATASASTATSTHKTPYGYQREVINGEERFCRDDPDTGSRLERTQVCLTWEELQAEERNKVQITRGRGVQD